jgi:hypothetical protein
MPLKVIGTALLLCLHIRLYLQCVLGAGYGRTGTTSLSDALDILGFPCYHMKVATKKDAKIWAAATDGKKVDWEKV